MPHLLVEYARDGLAVCSNRGCKVPIAVGEARIGVADPSSSVPTNATAKWRHLRCFSQRQATLAAVALRDIHGIDSLTPVDRQLVENRFSTRAAKLKAKAAAPKPRPRARKRCREDDEGDTAEDATWVWQNDTGAFVPFDEEICIMLEQSMDRRVDSVFLTLGDVWYQFHLKELWQRNTKTGKRRTIKRVPAS